MAAKTCINAVHGTFTSTTADSVTFSGGGGVLRITNRDGTNTLYFRLDATTAVAAANENYVVMPNQAREIELSSTGGLRISLVGNGGGYSAELY